MSQKFRAKAKRAARPDEPRLPEKDGNIGKLKILFCLIFTTGLAGGVYIAAARAEFSPVFHAYWIISAVLLCTALLLNQRNEYRYTKDKACGDPDEAKKASEIRDFGIAAVSLDRPCRQRVSLAVCQGLTGLCVFPYFHIKEK